MQHKNVYRIAPFGVHWAIENDEFGFYLYFSKCNALNAAKELIKGIPDAIIKIYDNNGKFEKSIQSCPNISSMKSH